MGKWIGVLIFKSKARRFLYQEIDWLKERKGFIGKAVETSVNATLDIYSEKLIYKDWIDLVKE